VVLAGPPREDLHRLEGQRSRDEGIGLVGQPHEVVGQRLREVADHLAHEVRLALRARAGAPEPLLAELAPDPLHDAEREGLEVETVSRDQRPEVCGSSDRHGPPLAAQSLPEGQHRLDVSS
jgi:hypothetical protein